MKCLTKSQKKSEDAKSQTERWLAKQHTNKHWQNQRVFSTFLHNVCSMNVLPCARHLEHTHVIP